MVGNDVPMPPEGTVYRVWLLAGTQATFATDFVPEPGMMVVELEFDPSQYDRVLISVEPAGSKPDTRRSRSGRRRADPAGEAR